MKDGSAAVIELETVIRAPVERVFDLARSIDVHLASAAASGERAVAGRTSGLLGSGETFTWEARHFGVKQRLTVRMTAFRRPWMFEDRMTEGAFASMRHVHRFEPAEGGTRMMDDFHFAAPFGILGRIAESLFLTRYMTRFLTTRNRVLKNLAETDGWRRHLAEPPAS